MIKFKRLLAGTLILGMLLSGSSLVFAEEHTNLELSESNVMQIPDLKVNESKKIPIGDIEYLKDDEGNIIKTSDLLTFDTQEEADNYIKDLTAKLNRTFYYDLETKENGISTMSNTYDTIVAKQSFAAGLGEIRLRVNYTTSGSIGHTGRITNHRAYTQISGMTVGIKWDEKFCDSQITSSGKDILAQTAGELSVSLIIDGFLDFYKVPVNMRGYAYAIH